MNLSPKLGWRRALTRMVLLVVLLLLAAYAVTPVAAAEPVATTEPVSPCVHVASAGTIKIYRCTDQETGFEFYVNNIGFMLAGPQ